MSPHQLNRVLAFYATPANAGPDGGKLARLMLDLVEAQQEAARDYPVGRLSAAQVYALDRRRGEGGEPIGDGLIIAMFADAVERLTDEAAKSVEYSDWPELQDAVAFAQAVLSLPG